MTPGGRPSPAELLCAAEKETVSRAVPGSPTGQLGRTNRYSGLLRQRLQQLVLERLVVDRVVRFAQLAVVPVSAGPEGVRVVAGHQPFLRLVAELQIVGGAPPTHPGGNPPRVNGIAPNVRAQASDCGHQCRHEQLAVLVRARAPASPIY